MSKDTSGPAFPSELGPLENDHMIQTGNCQWHHPGMTIRDYFAAKAMQSAYIHYSGDDEATKHWTSAGLAESAYAMADAMLEARK